MCQVISVKKNNDFFLESFKFIAFALNDRTLSSDQNTNQFLV